MKATRAYQHPVVKEYKEEYPKVSKADVEKKLLNKFGIEKSMFFGPSILAKTQLAIPENRKLLLDHLEKCNIILNNPKYLLLRHELLAETITVMRSIFSNSSWTNENFEKLAGDLHYLMSHRSKTHDSKYPNHAQDLRMALIKDLPKEGENSPQSLQSIKAIVDSALKSKIAATKIQSVLYRGHVVRNDPYLKIKKRIQMHMETLAKKIKISWSAAEVNKNFEEIEQELLKIMTLDKFNQLAVNIDLSPNGLLELAKANIANCASYTLILFCLLMEDPEIDYAFKCTLKIVRLYPPENHAFLISKPKGHQIQVHDGWFQLVNLPAKTGYRRNDVFSRDRLRGYDGNLDDFKNFLDDHADGKFVIKGLDHNIQYFDIDLYKISSNRKLIYDHYYPPNT